MIPLKCISVLSVIAIIFFVNITTAEYPFNNISLTWTERVNDLVSRLTLDEIMHQMSAVKGGVPAIPRIGIKPYSWGTECLRGDVRAGKATSFPEAIGLAAMFSENYIFKVARATGLEVRAKNNNYTKHGEYGSFKGLSCLSPVINIMRDSRWGRNEETYGEDPFLSGSYAAAFVKGLQGDNERYLLTNAGCKHVAAYGGPENIPTSRFTFNAEVSIRDLRTTFLPAFRSCVKAGSYNLMCSYNSVNGIPACANKWLLTDILRREWGFQGYVISDAGAITNIRNKFHYTNSSIDTIVACLDAGCNMELPGGDEVVYDYIVNAVNDGRLAEQKVRDTVKPLWYTRMRLGEFDPDSLNPYKQLNLSLIQSTDHQQLSLEAALKSFVLLKNLNGALPLNNMTYADIAIIGPLANNPYSQFGDYTPTIDLKYTTTPLQSLRFLGKKVHYAAGCKGDNRCLEYNSTEIIHSVKEANIVFVCLGLGNEIECEGRDRHDISLPVNQFQLLQDAVNNSPAKSKVILILFNAGPVDIRWADNHDKVVGILEVFYPAQATGQALRIALIANLDALSPFGRLPFTWPLSSDQLPPMTNYSMAGRTYRYSHIEPLYPFGYGLTYSSFKYSNLKYINHINAGSDVIGSVDLHNIGPSTPYEVAEVIQVYLSWNDATVETPIRQLVNFTRYSVQKFNTITVKFSITGESMAVWREDNMGWQIEPGRYSFSVGGQQPNQKKTVGSNVLMGQFIVTGSKFLGKY